MSEKQRVLILCTGNVARSQMAEGLLRHMADDRFEVFSAGLLPSYVRPNAIAVMNELGIDISHHRSKSLDEFLDTHRRPGRSRRRSGTNRGVPSRPRRIATPPSIVRRGPRGQHVNENRRTASPELVSATPYFTFAPDRALQNLIDGTHSITL